MSELSWLIQVIYIGEEALLKHDTTIISSEIGLLLGIDSRGNFRDNKIATCIVFIKNKILGGSDGFHCRASLLSTLAYHHWDHSVSQLAPIASSCIPVQMQHIGS
jgi:hypothetical protein